MKKEDEQVSGGLNQIFEIINAKGDKGEIEEILKNRESSQETEGNPGDYMI